MNIVFLDGATLNPGDLSWEEFEKLGNFTVYDRTQPEEVVGRAAMAEILIVNKTRLSETHFDQLPHLKLVCVAATGFDLIDTAAARKRGITVCNAAGYGSRAVAQMVVALLLEVTNQVGFYARENRNGFWSNSEDFCCWNSPLIELDGKKFGVVGFGNIGKTVVEMLRPFGLQFYAVTSKKEEQLPSDVMPVTLEDLFHKCDFVSLNCPLTSQNERFVNKKLLDGAKRGLVLINTARGKLIDEEAVAESLREGHLGAYCCDVLSQEPPSKDHVLLTAPNCYITPHIAWATQDARNRIIKISIDNINSFLTGNPKNVVNP